MQAMAFGRSIPSPVQLPVQGDSSEHIYHQVLSSSQAIPMCTVRTNRYRESMKSSGVALQSMQRKAVTVINFLHRCRDSFSQHHTPKEWDMTAQVPLKPYHPPWIARTVDLKEPDRLL